MERQESKKTMNLRFLQRLLTLIQRFLMNPDKSNSGSIYLMAISKLGHDASPNDLVDDDVACAESVTTILHTLWPEMPIITGTWTLWEYLKKSKHFQKTLFPQKGDIVISPTGTGNGRLRNGHVGIVGEGEMIISNDSPTGLFLENFTMSSWKKKYVGAGGFPMEFYRKT